MNHLMIDLETMGSRPTSAIVAIGAVFFNESGLGDRFYCTVDLESCMKSGLTVDGGTIMWWLKQSEEARKALYDDPKPLERALLRFADFYASRANKNTRVWGNGADFDNAILSNAYQAAASHAPWPYWANGCYRTIKSLNPNIKHERKGTHHNALDDAIYQAEHLRKLLGWAT